MRVLIFSNVSGGLFLFRRELIECLIEQGHDVTVAAADTGYTDDLICMGCHYIKTIIELHGMNPIVEMRLLLRYRTIIREVSPDIVLTYTIKPNIYAGFLCSAYKIPYLVNITGLGSTIYNRGKKQKFMLWLYKKGIKNAEVVFCQNANNLNYLLENRMIKGKYALIPGSGVNLERFEMQEYPESETINFFFIARVMKEKGIEEFLKAAYHFSDNKRIKFHICGNCSEEYLEIIEESTNRGVITYHGLVRDMTKIQSINSCTIHPSYHEGMSNVLLETFASGRPAIGSNIPGCREIIDDGKSGFLIQRGNADDLIQKIEQFTRMSIEDRKKMGIEGRKKVEKEFDRRIVINKYLSAVDLIKEKRSKRDESM